MFDPSAGEANLFATVPLPSATEHPLSGSVLIQLVAVGPVGPVAPVGPVVPVGNVDGGIGGSVGPIKFGANAVALKKSSDIRSFHFFYLT